MRTALLLVLASAPTLAAQDRTLRDQVRSFREHNEPAIVRELVDFLAIPNVASNLGDIRRNADHLQRMLTKRGVRSEILEVPGAPVSVYGELITPGATKTVVFYAHFDGQPVDSAKWASHAFQPMLRSGPLAPGVREVPVGGVNGRFDGETRVFARSASDDKSPIVAMLWALDALAAAGTRPSVNLKFFLEGEEEAGSTHVRAILTKYRVQLAADFWIFGDGPVHQSRAAQAVFGVRGVVGADLTVYGPSRPLHSGHYGNWAPNPNAMMVHLLASMRDVEGRITIPGFYDDVAPVTAADRAALQSVPAVERQLLGELRLGRTEGSPASLAEQLALPALNMSGLAGGPAGEGGANLIGTASRAYLDFRLVPRQTPDRVQALVEGHLRRQGYHVVPNEPDSATLREHPKVVQVTWSNGYPAARTAMTHPGGQAMLKAADRMRGTPLIRVPTLGGSLPLADFVEVLGIPFAVLPIVNHDNNQHGENENLRLENLWDGIELYAGVLAWMGREWQTVP